MANASFRECCYQCAYANLRRQGDITIGDCHISKKYPDFHPGIAKSTVLINTEKGHKIWSMNKSEIDSDILDIDSEVSINTQLKHPSHRPAERDNIYNDMHSMDAYSFKTRYGRHDSKLKSIIFGFLNLLPIKFK